VPFTVRMELLRHPASPPSPVDRIEVLAANVGNGHLSLVFSVTGDLAAIRIPPPLASGRADGLWQHTCFEAFIRPPRGEEYVEINLAPSGQWAAYRFDGYRSGMGHAEIPEPKIVSHGSAFVLGLVAQIDLGALPEFAGWETWQAAINAVIEAADGSVSHWALAHPADMPDFHHADAFVLELPPAGGLAHPPDLP
jgi:hypothetical protein